MTHSEATDLLQGLPDMRGPIPGTPIRASIVVVLYGGLQFTHACVRSLAENWDMRDQLILVDNASPDETGTWLDSVEDRVVVIRNSENRNFSGGCNDGALVARGEYVVFLNNDVVVQPGWLDPLVTAAAVPNTGIVGTLLQYPDGTVQHAGVAISGSVDEIAFHIHAGRSPKLPVVQRAREMQAVTAACFVLPRHRFLELGGFDEGYINGLEDVDLCLRARAAGLRNWYEPGVGMVHHESVTDGRFAHVQHNVLRFLERWSGDLVPDAHGHDDTLLPRPGYPAGIDVVDATHGDFGAAFNRAVCDGMGAHLLVRRTDDAPSDTLAPDDSIHVLGDGTHVTAILLPRAALYAIGGIDLALDPALQLADWLDRARLHGWSVVDRSGGVLASPSPWFSSSLIAGLDQDIPVRRWGHCAPKWRRRSIYEPLVWEPQLEHADAELDLRTRSALLVWADDPAAFGAALETLLTSIATTDDVSVVIRVDPKEPEGIDLLDSIADRVAGVRELPDVVLVEGGPEGDVALASAVDLVVELPGPAGRRLASIAHAAGCAAAPADDAAFLLGVPVDSVPLPPSGAPHTPAKGSTFAHPLPHEPGPSAASRAAG